MEGRITPEPPSEEGFADLLSRAEEGPVVMLNLLSFKPDGGRERYLEYGAAVLPLLEKVGGQVVFQGEASPVVLGGESWDLVLLVEYPTRRAFLEMVQSPEYQELGAADLSVPSRPSPGVHIGLAPHRSGRNVRLELARRLPSTHFRAEPTR